jgi:hypothetical protein
VEKTEETAEPAVVAVEAATIPVATEEPTPTTPEDDLASALEEAMHAPEPVADVQLAEPVAEEPAVFALDTKESTDAEELVAPAEPASAPEPAVQEPVEEQVEASPVVLAVPPTIEVHSDPTNPPPGKPLASTLELCLLIRTSSRCPRSLRLRGRRTCSPPIRARNRSPDAGLTHLHPHGIRPER